MIDKKQLDENIKSWQGVVSDTTLPLYDDLPKLELYMDQVVVLVNDYLSHIFKLGIEEKQVTASMINNYVKMKIIPAPNKKRYSRVHLSRLVVICLLKQSLNISTIKNLLPQTQTEDEHKKFFDRFSKTYSTALSDGMALINERLEQTASESDEKYLNMITRSAVTADLYKMFTERFSQLVYCEENKTKQKDV